MSTGPGSICHITPEAREALEKCDVIAGYHTYLALLGPLLNGKELISTGMKAEVERCCLAIEQARSGRSVAIVSSGDAGIYGMAGLALEICKRKGFRVEPTGGCNEVDFYLDVIPGVPALAAGGALLGAPLMHDFASISLSDLLTPWETIQDRVRLAAQGDFVVVLYNPRSKRRNWQLGAVRDILLEFRPAQTPVGIVRKAAREGQSVLITTLGELLAHRVDMQTIVIVGNSNTQIHGPYMITPRGYLEKYGI